MPIQQMLLGAGAVATKPYVDDVFHVQVHAGNSATRSINNGIDLAGNGGLIWAKTRNVANSSHTLFDTVRGATKYLSSNDGDAEATYTGNGITSFNNNGYTLGDDSSWQGLNHSGNKYVLNTFCKASGFFDVVTYTGNGSNRTIAHSLGSVPGMIIVKNTSSSGDWSVYHRSTTSTKYLKLNETYSAGTNSAYWNDTEPTASVFSLGSDDDTNTNNATYIAYLFAGGKSTQNEAVSVDFDGSNDYLSIPDSSDFTIGTNYTAECWFYTDAIGNAGWDAIFGQWSGSNAAATNSWVLEYVGSSPRFYYINSGGTLAFKSLVDEANGEVLALKQWYHFAFVKSGSTTKLYLNGILKQSFDTTYQDGSGSFNIGGNVASGGWFNGKVSNVRIVNGTAVYTSSFRPPTAPLTNITNTKLLCCNDSSQTGSTVTPGTITNNGSTASSDSPFDDSAAFTFGENEDQNIIKCGSYVGNGSSSGPKINLGWEPSWVMIKISSGANYGWTMLDTMRGIPTGGNNARLRANESGAEDTAMGELINVNPTGFQLKDSTDSVNASGNTYVYMAIRRPDGYCGKPIEDATKCFAMDTGDGDNSTTIPNYDSGFPVDFALSKTVASSAHWFATARLIGTKELSPDQNIVEDSASEYVWDSNLGWGNGAWQDSSYQSWMWKRHAGFDVVNFVGNQTSNHQIRHSLNAVPEMMWLKSRGGSEDWAVYHKGLDGGTNPETHYLLLNSNDAEADGEMFSDTAPTSTHFTVGNFGESNDNSENMLAMLFASVDGISKIGYYTGSNGSATPPPPYGDVAQTITTGFSPRFVIIKRVDSSNNWLVLDTTRGWGSGNEANLFLDANWAQSAMDFGGPTSTGFTLTYDELGYYNSNGAKYIYYAHA